MVDEKVPPHSLDAEKSTLGSMMLDEEAVIAAEMKLNASDFYWRSHAEIYSIILELFNNQKPVDLVSVNEKLRDKEKIEDVGGVSYITSLTNQVPTAANIKHYTEIVKEKSILRRGIKAAEQIKKLGYNNTEANDLINQAEEMIFELSDNDAAEDVYDLAEQLRPQLEDIWARENEELTGLSTPWKKINDSTAGLQNGDLVMIAARPSMGKTALMINQALHSAKQGESVAIFSAEMSKEKLMDRILAYEAGVNGLRLKRGKLNDEEKKRLNMAASDLYELDFKIINNTVKDITEIKSIARQLDRKNGLDVVMVDFLQLLQGYENENNRNLQVGRQAKTFKNLAGELEVPILLLSQLNRGVEQRNDKRPKMSDLRDSGEVEEVADVIMMLYREEYYDPDTEKQGILEVNLAKNRDGRTGSVELSFQKEKQQINSLSRRQETTA